MVIGDNPGPEENEHGIPFLGRGGRLLMELLMDAWPEDSRPDLSGFTPNEESDDPNYEYFYAMREYLDNHIFWANVVNCMTPEARPPTTQEIKNCKDRLHALIYAVDPMFIIATGKSAATTLVGKSVNISTKGGTIYDISVTSPVTGKKVRYPMMAILAPAYLLRQGDQSLFARKQGTTYETSEHLKAGLALLNQQYLDLYGTPFPDRS